VSSELTHLNIQQHQHPDCRCEDKTTTVGRSDYNEATLGEAALGKVSLGEVSLGKVSLGEVSLGEVSLGKVSLGKYHSVRYHRFASPLLILLYKD
jgi:hypothetical protein